MRKNVVFVINETHDAQRMIHHEYITTICNREFHNGTLLKQMLE
jgi:hypothetical protein